MSHLNIAAIIFIAAYALFAVLPEKRTLVAVVAASLTVFLGVISPKEAFWAVNWNVMGIFVGTLVVAEMFMESRVPAYLAEIIVNKISNAAWVLLFICALTGVISAFVENVATVLIVAPIALSLSKRLKMNPVKIMIAIAISSNLQGAATLIGDPPSMLLAGAAKMNFIDFFFFKGKPSIFFAVELGAIASCMVLYLIFRKQKEKPAKITVEKIKTWFPTGVLIGLILILAGTSFLDTDFSYMAGAVSMLAAAVCFAWAVFEKKMPLVKGIKALDWDTTFFLGAVFIIVGAVTRAGWINIMAENLARVIGGNLFMGYTLLVIVAVLVSAVVDNVPFLAAMLPVAISVSEKIGAPPYLLLFGLLIGASLGGNITPIGASANIVACGLLKKEGYNVTFPEFMKIGVPFTLAAVSAGYIFLWMVWR